MGPGVDLRGAEAAAILGAAAPMLAWLEAREPGAIVRAISVKDARILVTLESEPKPRALRIEDPSLRDAAKPAEAILASLVERALSRRA